MPKSPYHIRTLDDFRYVEEGPSSDAPPVVLLHGMLGDLSNWNLTIEALSDAGFQTIVPVLPVYELPLNDTTVTGLVDHVRAFLEARGLQDIVLVGNSLGGHVAMLYAISFPEHIRALVLSGASGIYEVEMGTSVFRRKDRDELRRRAAFTFYDPRHATDELVEEVYGIVNDRGRALRLIRMARAVQAESVESGLTSIKCPTLLIWGADDRITPPDVAETFRGGIPQARLRFIEECGHAPMIERPDKFNQHMIEFLDESVRQSVYQLSGS